MTTREKILALLQQETSVLSGEKIAQKLDISRTAVWKAIKELEKKATTLNIQPAAIAIYQQIVTNNARYRKHCRW